MPVVGVNPTYVDVLIGVQIRSAREHSNQTILKLAELIDCGREDILSFEFGWRRPSAKQILQLAQAFSLPISYFFRKL